VLRIRAAEGPNARDLELGVTDDLGPQLGAELRERNLRAHWAVLNLWIT
jgi:hypothetical protein